MSGADETYFRYLEGGEWRIQKCADCGAHAFVPRVFCPSCEGDNLDWVKPSGMGTVYSFTVVRRREEDGGTRNVALVDLAEGVRMMSRVDGIANEDIRIGMPVEAVLISENGENIITFVPTSGAGGAS